MNMQTASQIIEIIEQGADHETLPLEVVKGGRKAKKQNDEALSRFLRTYRSEERFRINALIDQIERSPIYIEPAADPATARHFGWNRGNALKLETAINGRWSAWLNINSKLHYDEASDEIPHLEFERDSVGPVKKMLAACMNSAYASGYRGHDFMEWLGYSLGISWFEKPKVDDRTWAHWAEHFDLSLLYLYPSDYLSNFLIEYQNQSGVGDYYPTPGDLTKLINQILGMHQKSRSESVYEPCLGAGAMLLTSESINLVGADFNLAMVKAASIQAFLYQPWLLYVPAPITGIHFSQEEMRLTRYFEFDTNTRIYCGDSLLGEYTAPADIFDDKTDRVDIYLSPLDLSKNSALACEKEFMTCDWSTASREQKWRFTKAQARNIPFECIASNPPFGATNKHTMQRIRELEKLNKSFLAERQEWLELLERPAHPHHEVMIDETMLKMDKHGQMAFF